MPPPSPKKKKNGKTSKKHSGNTSTSPVPAKKRKKQTVSSDEPIEEPVDLSVQKVGGCVKKPKRVKLEPDVTCETCSEDEYDSYYYDK